MRTKSAQGKRIKVMFSASPENTDASLVLKYLATLPERQRSAALWRITAAALRGDVTGALVSSEDDDDDDSALDDLLDAL